MCVRCSACWTVFFCAKAQVNWTLPVTNDPEWEGESCDILIRKTLIRCDSELFPIQICCEC